MDRRLIVLAVGAGALLISGERYSARTSAAEASLPLLDTLSAATRPDEVCMMPEAGYAYAQAPAGGTAGATSVPANWPGKPVIGGNVTPIRVVYDQYPTNDGIAVDPENGVVVTTDENLGTLLLYDTTQGAPSKAQTEPKRLIYGPRAGLGHLAGVALDPIRREIITNNNDGGGLVVHSYDSHGNIRPVRRLSPPHQSWGISLDLKSDEMAITSQQYQGISFFKRTATGADRPVRTIRGMETGLADPHGVVVDNRNDEVFTANHGNWTEMRSYAADGPPVLPGEYIPGRFEAPSIIVHQASANGNVPPKRKIQGASTKLNWPMGVDMDQTGNEVAVANYGTSEILFFKRDAQGNAAPVRAIGGSQTGIVGPIGVAIDHKRNEIWVANYGDHTSVVFDRTATGNVAPKRIIRNAPAGTPTTGFTNAASAAYDSNRHQLLVPN
jgi:DNA-binding beta-propeller fold protein YncE